MFDDDRPLRTSGFPVVMVNGIGHILGGDAEHNNTQFQCKPSSLPTGIFVVVFERVWSYFHSMVLRESSCSGRRYRTKHFKVPV